MAYQTTDPTTNKQVKTYPSATADEVEAFLDNGHAFYQKARQETPTDRVAVLRDVAQYFRDHEEDFAKMITTEMGKRRVEARSEVASCASIADYYANNSSRLLAPTPIATDAGAAIINHLSTGVIFGVEPWNFPLYQLMRVFAPNFMVGNAVIIKPASNVPGSALAFEAAVRSSGADKGAFQIALIDYDGSDQLIQDSRVTGVCLTGSEKAGAMVAASAGKALKPSLLELGGMDAFLVLEGADLATALPEAVETRLMNCGQVCTSSKRFIVLDNYYDDFIAGLKKSFADVTIGDPNDDETDMGPLNSQKHKENLQAQVDEAIAHGAKVIYGNEPVERDGAFFQPTILTDINKANPAYHTELFGPVACVYRVASEEEAIALANDVPYGLGGAVFAGDTNHAAEVAAKLETGMVGANQTQSYQAELPFGGVKHSGYGRELGELGQFSFVNHQTVTRALR